MGLYIHSLLEIPADAKRNYYIYLLDYGWSEPLAESLFKNFQQMADLASKHNAIVIRGTADRVHFTDDVFSWHNINGENGEELLPGILITNRNPHEFKESFSDHSNSNSDKKDFKIIFFPLKKYCKTTTDVANYVDKIFKDILEKKDLSDFKIKKEMKKGLGRALVDGLLLEPNIAGVGYNFNEIINYFRQK